MHRLLKRLLLALTIKVVLKTVKASYGFSKSIGGSNMIIKVF